MTNQNTELLNRVVNTLMLINTHGEDSFGMVQCIQTIQKIIESEAALAKERACAPVIKEE